MHILYITPHNPFIKTPETGFAEEIRNRGHEVTFSFGLTPEILKGKYDIVFGAMEYSMSIAKWIGRKLNIPVYTHMEWIPPWRVGLENPRDWGYERPDQLDNVKASMNQWIETYVNQMMDWEDATVRSTCGNTLIYTLVPFSTKPIDATIKYYAADLKKLEKYRDDSIEEKYQIMSTARLVPHKRIIHIVRALAKIKNAPKYVVIGYGEELRHIKAEAEKLGVNIEFRGSGQEGIKERTIQESMFSINIWAGIPMAESFYYEKPAITYKEHHIYEVLEDAPLYAERNNINDLAKQIEYFLDNPKIRRRYGKKAKELMMTNKIGMGTMDKIVDITIKILEDGVKEWNEK